MFPHIVWKWEFYFIKKLTSFNPMKCHLNLHHFLNLPNPIQQTNNNALLMKSNISSDVYYHNVVIFITKTICGTTEQTLKTPGPRLVRTIVTSCVMPKISFVSVSFKQWVENPCQAFLVPTLKDSKKPWKPSGDEIWLLLQDIWLSSDDITENFFSKKDEARNDGGTVISGSEQKWQNKGETRMLVSTSDTWTDTITQNKFAVLFISPERLSHTWE